VRVGGGLHDGGARFARLAAKVPARRVPESVDRLLGLFEAEHASGETARAYFARVDVARVKALLADLEALAPADAKPEDFVDLGDQGEFTVEVAEGECSA
jgi:hypothetical protein